MSAISSMSRPPLYLRRPFLAGVLRQLPLTAVLVAVAAGLGLVTVGHWRTGLIVVGLSLAGGGGLRAVLPVRRAGFLAVRSRGMDVVLMAGAGLALAVIAWVVPPT